MTSNDSTSVSHIEEGITGILDGLEDDTPANHVPTGFADLDALTGGGLRPGALTVIASRPGIGRTTFLSDICRHTAIANGTPAVAWTLEEQREDFTARLMAAEASVRLTGLRSGNLTEDEWTRFAKRTPEVTAAPLYIDAPASITAADLADTATRLVTEYGVRLIAIDGIQDIRPSKRSDLREREVGDVVRDLKTLARELQVPVLATSHLNRGAEQRIDRRPAIDDLRESGAITYAADLIILLHRDDAYERDTPRAGEADLIVAKHRHGPTGVVVVAFQGHYGRFVDMAGEL